MKLKNQFILAVFITLSLSLKAQEDYNTQIWTDFNYMSFIGGKTAVFGDVGYRHQLNDPNWHQIIVRPSIQYNRTSMWNFIGGIGYFHKVYNGDSFDKELRPFQGVKTNLPIFRRFHFRNYFRIEERFFLNSETQFSFRLRNQFRVNVILFNKHGRMLAIPLAGEWFFDRLGDDIETLERSRERYFVGVDYRRVEWRVKLLFNVQGNRTSPSESLVRSDVMFRVRFFYYFKPSSDFKKKTVD